MTRHQFLNYFIAAVWIANGLFCKVLDLVPRHREIVAGIIGNDHAGSWTKAIGFAEIAMGIWILSGFMKRVNVIAQVIIIATMNIIEFVLVPDLLLWGRLNALFALMFIILILYNEFYPVNKPAQQT